MPQTWTGRPGWTLTLEAGRLTLRDGERVDTFAGTDTARLRVGWWWFRRCLVIDGPAHGARRRLPGLNRRDGEAIRTTLARIVARAKVRDALALAAAREPVFARLLETRVRTQRWIAYDDVSAVLAGLPRRDALLATLTIAERDALPATLSESEARALAFLGEDHRGHVAAANAEIARRELAAGKQFFATVEKSPLTKEQARAVVTLDNRVRVVAAAGSGKTSVMVARAAYAIRRGFVDPDRVLMLAFNADAAAELRERLEARLGALGLPHEGVEAATFHSFGLSVIGEAAGRKPRIAPFVEGGRDVDKVRELIARAGGAEIEGVARKELAPLVRSFMSHVKANGLTREEVARRASLTPGLDVARTRAFLDLYWQVHDLWQEDLRAARAVDFDDMLTMAAEHLERDPGLARWDLVMVDEFQDTSRARARLVRALLRPRGTYLLAVGDDWQAINRFAGADLSVMTDFDAVFGPALTRRLETTFRSPQEIADAAGRFVSRNHAQIAKTVRAARGASGTPVTVVRVPRKGDLTAAIAAHLAGLADDGDATVDVLGRYSFDEKLLPSRRPSGLTVNFRTVHRSKGLEADHVILPNVTTGRYGFPGSIQEDPLLALAMPGADPFEHAEERRLFYVALTRARRSVTVFTVAGRESPFVEELLEDPGVVVREVDPRAVAEVAGESPSIPTQSARSEAGTGTLRRG
ncbi:UvrD-helicase domain-containing protein [Demequina phytophila]|uniref:UvrD-helicase domain-containing protein n=1 Tax=Demequina phytophila TaxID=1638981 RepID=UPI00078283DC|nr:UvrD-helicase domain-containing protein [Demequina phytophila]